MKGFRSVANNEFCIYLENKKDVNMIQNLLRTKAGTELAGKDYVESMKTIDLLTKLEEFKDYLCGNEELKIERKDVEGTDTLDDLLLK